MTATLSSESDRASKGELKAWHALMWFLGFFGFMFVVNGIFLWTAITTFRGEDVEKSYLTGLDYNSEIARRAHQSDKGWGAEIGLDAGSGGRDLRIRLTERDGSPLSDLGISALLHHPTDRALDRVLELQATGIGEYSASLDEIASGVWSVQVTADIDAQRDGDEFKASRDLLLP